MHWMRARTHAGRQCHPSRQSRSLHQIASFSLYGIAAYAGLLDGKRATTHWWSLTWMRESFPEVTVIDDQHVVEDGDVFTSAGISSGIDMALRVVARHHGEAVARATARHMEYPFPDDNRRRA